MKTLNLNKNLVTIGILILNYAIFYFISSFAISNIALWFAIALCTIPKAIFLSKNFNWKVVGVLGFCHYFIMSTIIYIVLS